MKKNGLTLLELLITLAIIGILASLTYPLYISHLQRARRNEAKIALHHLANAMEKYHAINGSYAKATLEECQVIPFTSGEFYRLEIKSADNHSFELMAVAQKSQQQDPCQTMILNEHNKFICE